MGVETVGDLGPSIAKQHLVRVIADGPVRVVAGETSLREILLHLRLTAASTAVASSTG